MSPKNTASENTRRLLEDPKNPENFLLFAEVEALGLSLLSFPKIHEEGIYEFLENEEEDGIFSLFFLDEVGAKVRPISPRKPGENQVWEKIRKWVSENSESSLDFELSEKNGIFRMDFRYGWEYRFSFSESEIEVDISEGYDSEPIRVRFLNLETFLSSFVERWDGGATEEADVIPWRGERI